MELPFSLSEGQALYMAAALFVAAIIRGYSGFGFSAITMAFAALIINPLPIIPVIFACEIMMTAFQARGIKAHIDWKRASALLLGTLLAIAPAVFVMARLDAEIARLAVSLIILIFSGLLLTGWQFTKPVGNAGHFGVGIVAGMANSAGVGGLPAATFLASQPLPPAVFRATMVVFLTGIDLFTLPVMALNGLVGADTLTGIILAFPILGAGIFVGTRLFALASVKGFRRLVVALLGALSILNILALLW